MLLLFRRTKGGVGRGEGDGDWNRKVSASSFVLLLEGFLALPAPSPSLLLPPALLLFFISKLFASCCRCHCCAAVATANPLVSSSSNTMDGGDEKAGGGRFRRICVFCGSRSGNRPAFSNAALELGKQLVDRKIDLVYGGGSVGLMGLVSQTVFDGGCHVLGVIPRALLPHEISGETIGEVKTVADMHERKSEMAKHADAFIALPGGYGTMEELLEMITWSQLGIHEKPVGLLNVDGYYNSLLALFDKGVEEGFIQDSARHIVVSAETVEELFRKMEMEEERTSCSLRKRSC